MICLNYIIYSKAQSSPVKNNYLIPQTIHAINNNLGEKEGAEEEKITRESWSIDTPDRLSYATTLSRFRSNMLFDNLKSRKLDELTTFIYR